MVCIKRYNENIMNRTNFLIDETKLEKKVLAGGS